VKVAALALALLTGCATIIAGGPDAVPITTNPPGAYVYVNGQVVGQTPMMVELDRGANMADIRIYSPGFQPVQITRYKSMNGWLIGSIILLPLLVPIIVDFATGNWQRFDDSGIAIGLTPGQAPPPYGMQPTLPMQPMQPMQPPQPPPMPPPR